MALVAMAVMAAILATALPVLRDAAAIVATAAVAGTLPVQRVARTAVRRKPHDPPEREARKGEEVISVNRPPRDHLPLVSVRVA
ncbi:hypothetical protein AB0O28_18290 [Microbispora sp. NPDC088329]|uniref:hypothetical protein n=1 Tax=Microbispora sp. NPDC088329 TaxID=3154869 RepID=UPI00343FAED8